MMASYANMGYAMPFPVAPGMQVPAAPAGAAAAESTQPESTEAATTPAAADPGSRALQLASCLTSAPLPLSLSRPLSLFLSLSSFTLFCFLGFVFCFGKNAPLSILGQENT